MVYKKIIFFYCCVVSLSGQYIPADKVDNQKASIKLKSCTTMICYLDTIKKINKKDSHTTIENNNIFSIYLVNIDNIIATKNEYFDLFPNLVVQSGSNSNNKNTHLEKQIITAYKTALNYYKNKNYQESYKLFNILFKKNLNDPNINFYLGRNAFELQKYQEALVAYERVLFEKPDSLRTQFEVGKTHFFNQDYKSAKSVFEVLLSNQKLSTNVKKKY
jgi:tetratricopeptide (TPR) repeat protein